MRPIRKTLAVATIIAALSTTTAYAGTSRVEYRYPDNPTVAYSTDGTIRHVSADQPMAFSAFESAISTADARAVLDKGGFVASEYPTRVAKQPAQPKALVFEARSLEPVNTFVAEPLPIQSNFTIQAGAFGSYDNATRLSDQLSAFGETQISSGNKNGKTIYRVQLGGWNSKADAAPTLQMIKANGFEGFVTSAS